jgi:hypothetical protein
VDGLQDANGEEIRGSIDAPNLSHFASRGTFAGATFENTPENSQRSIRGHYDRHIWLYRENPNGLFAQYNPNATCEHHVIVMPDARDPLDVLPKMLKELRAGAHLMRSLLRYIGCLSPGRALA